MREPLVVHTLAATLMTSSSLATVHAEAPTVPQSPILSPDGLTQVATILTPAERIRVDAAGEGLYRSLHRDSVDDVMRDVREARAGAVVLSVSYCERAPSESVATMVREFPRVTTLALLSELGPRTPQTLLSLGTSGVRRLIDVRDASGWRALRSALTECGTSLQRLALRRLAQDLEGATHDCWRFFEALFLSPPSVTTVRRLSRRLDVVPSTLMSRFFRAGLPAPKRFLAMARLVRAANLFENHGFSVANIANHLEYSSPQSFGRHVRTLLHLTAVEFRERYDGEGMLERFRADLVLPNLATLRRLAPLSNVRSDLRRSGQRAHLEA
jgi:AraC-like DNA-binding protein